MREILSDIRNFIRTPAPEPMAFETLARRLFVFQYEHNQPYRGFCNARRITPDNLRHISEIPAIPTTAFKELELSALDPTARTRVFHSSGTTEQKRSRHFHSEETLRIYEDSLLRWFEPHLCPDRTEMNVLILAPTASEAPNSSLVHMFERVANQFGRRAIFAANVAADGGWMLDHSRIESAHHLLSQSDVPVLICGTAFSFVHLCDHLMDRGQTLSFPPGSRIFETGGYKGRSRIVSKVELHALITERLSIPQTHIVTEYGMSEISAQAYDRIIGQSTPRWFRFPQWARASIVSPETGLEVTDGETGLIRIVDLSNVGSVLAIQTEDLAIRRGDAFELIGRAEFAEARGCSLMQLNR